MSTLNLKSAVSLGDAAVIPALGPVTFKAVFPPRSGTPRAHKPYTVQDVILSDGENEVRGAFWDCPELGGLKGQTKVIHSVKASNNRLSGVSVKAGKDQNNQPRWEINVSKSALILDPEVVNANTNEVKSTAVTGTTTPASAPRDPLPGSFAEKASQVVKASALPAKPGFDDVLALFTHCYHAASYLVPDSGDGPGLQARQAAAATLFIASTNQGLLSGAAQRYSEPAKTPKGETPF